MTGINSRRVWLGALGGWVVWMIWSMAINLGVLATGYAEAQKSGMLLTEPRYGFFLPAWFVTLFLLSCVLAWVYAGVRTTYGPGPGTAIKVGVLVGFAAGFPLALGLMGALLGRLGRRQEADAVIAELCRLSTQRHVGAVPVALVYQGLGDLDRALEQSL